MVQRLRTVTDPTATRAELRYTVERRFADATLVRVALVTGLQNQIRAQFAVTGHPVIGDRKYHPDEAQERSIDRVALHAARLRFTHPRSHHDVTVTCELPVDFQRALRDFERRTRPER
jgi:23S rRNA pseudouridine1911/1915/1917 synthase